MEPVGAEVCGRLFADVQKVKLGELLLDYIQDIVAFTRESGLYRSPLSTRGALALSKMSRSWAFLEGRDYAIPADVKQVLPYVCWHRLVLREGRHDPLKAADAIFDSVPADE